MSNKTGYQSPPTNWRKREELREKGQFWTPLWVAKAMTLYAVAEASEILDPATGNGAFLKALQEVCPNVVFYGFDIDEKLLSSPIYGSPRVFVEQRDFLMNPPATTFQAIVGNPPYIRHHRLDETTKARLKLLTLTIMGTTLDGRAGYHVYFLLQALNCLGEGGVLTFIMPADVCEGVFAAKLWRWITKNYRLEAVITFSEAAAPFPDIDTNAILFCLRRAQPSETFVWAKVFCDDHTLQEFVQSGFADVSNDKIERRIRSTQEALETGFSRPPSDKAHSRYTLENFAAVMRGIATGANEFFFLTRAQIEAYGLPMEFFKRTVGRTRDIERDAISEQDLENLDKAGRPTFLLSIEQPYEDLPETLRRYLQQGADLGLPARALIKLRRPWYKTEKRAVPALLFAYLGRRSTRFIKNDARVLPLHCLHCVYTYSNDRAHDERLWKVLNHPDTLSGLRYVSKSYGSGALKAEPQNLRRLPIPEYLVEQYELDVNDLSKNNRQIALL